MTNKTTKHRPATKHIDLNKSSFMANGREYFIMNDLSLARFCEYQKIAAELAFETGFKGVFDTLRSIYDACSSGNDIIAANHKCRELAYNQMNSIKDFQDRPHPRVLYFCSLFINRQGEDVGRFDARVSESKVNDWVEEGLAVEDFFVLAASFIPSFRKIYGEFNPHVQREDKEVSLNEKTSGLQTEDTTTKTTTGNSVGL